MRGQRFVPQGGTWIYDRAGWCPGAVVDTKDFELTPLVAGQDEFSVDYDITYDPDGNYRFEGQIVAYGPPNMDYDVEISQVLAPSDDKLESVGTQFVSPLRCAFATTVPSR